MEQKNKSLVEARLPTKYGTFQILAFPGDSEEKENLALVMGEIDGRILVRVHSECFTGDVLHSMRCDCGEQLDLAMKRISEEGKGIIIYLRQEGRGIGLVNKLKAYNGPTVECEIKDKYKRTKFLGVKYCDIMINENSKIDEKYKKMFKDSKKKDDLSDAYLQGIYWLKK